MAREIVNKVQKLRKAVGLNIDDHVEVFYKVVPATDASQIKQVVGDNTESIASALRTAFLSEENMQQHFVKIAETEYANPENEKDLVKLYICAPNVSFDNDKLQAKYGHLNKDKVNFVNDLKSYVQAHSSEALRKKVEQNGGKFRFKLNDQEVELNLREDFYFSALDQAQRKSD